MVVLLICVAAVVLALSWLGVLVGGVLRRLKDLDAQLVTARTQAATLNEALGQAPRVNSSVD